MTTEIRPLPETIIEIYDDEQIYNVIGSIDFRPTNVVFIGSRKLKSKRVKNNIISTLRTLNLDTKCFFYSTDMNSIESIMSELKNIINTFGECAIDLTGGSEVALVAVGMIARDLENEGRSLPLFRYDRYTCSYRNIHSCPIADGFKSEPHLSIASVLAMAGGMVKEHGHLSLDGLDKELTNDIFTVWGIYKKYHRSWAKAVSYFQQISKNLEADELHISAPSVIYGGERIAGADKAILAELADAGIINNFKQDTEIHFDYKNSLMRSCLCDTGICLELYVYAVALSSYIYDDVQISVVIDWDGNLDARINTINEIDVMLTRGIVPVFISCKSGTPNVTALNEIKTLASKFGGEYARAVLVTMADVKRKDRYLYQRAADMNVDIIDREDLIAERLSKKLYTLSKI